MYRVDSGLKAAIDKGRKRGYLTFHDVNEYLPDEGGDPSMIDDLVIALDELGLDLVEDPATKDADDAEFRGPSELGGEAQLAKSLMGPESSVLSSRDPIRMYLSQMGNIPLLSREREIFLAKQIEVSRKRFRRTILESDFALTIAVDTLEKVQANELPFERTLRTSDTEGARKEQIQGRMPLNLATLKRLLTENRADFDLSIAEGTTREQRKAIAERMVLRRRKMATLCEELSLRTQRLQPIMKRMQ
ncbi:MAG: RNA polymerase sigma factor region1.1 domain-containing protein, partial [Planctomycetaceae bacterium]